MEVLERKNYKKALSKICSVDFNTFFAQSVLWEHADGVVYTDDPASMHSLYIINNYGMSLLYSDRLSSIDPEMIMNQIIAEMPLVKNEWMQCFPEEWKNIMVHYSSPAVIQENRRINFQFDEFRFKQNRKEMQQDGIVITETTREIFMNMPGAVTPEYFWKNAELFLRFGKGFSVLCHGEVVTTAFSSYIMDNHLEIGIETVEKYRGKGYAQAACTALIEYTLQHGMMPVWSCRGDNRASASLAAALGFNQTKTLPYYHIKRP